MRPRDIQLIGQELAIRWADDSESFIPLQVLRRSCPCAACKGEVDVLGNLWMGPARSLPSSAFQVRRIDNVGAYGIQPVWGDSHSTGIYSFDYLKRIADALEK